MLRLCKGCKTIIHEGQERQGKYCSIDCMLIHKDDLMVQRKTKNHKYKVRKKIIPKTFISRNLQVTLHIPDNTFGNARIKRR